MGNQDKEHVQCDLCYGLFPEAETVQRTTANHVGIISRKHYCEECDKEAFAYVYEEALKRVYGVKPTTPPGRKLGGSYQDDPKFWQGLIGKTVFLGSFVQPYTQEPIFLTVKDYRSGFLVVAPQGNLDIEQYIEVAYIREFGVVIKTSQGKE